MQGGVLGLRQGQSMDGALRSAPAGVGSRSASPRGHAHTGTAAGPTPAPQVVHTGVGPVSHSDVQLAIPLGARILGFNVRSAAGDVEELAKMHGIDVRGC